MIICSEGAGRGQDGKPACRPCKPRYKVIKAKLNPLDTELEDFKAAKVKEKKGVRAYY
jgi:hypothetical protein